MANSENPENKKKDISQLKGAAKLHAHITEVVGDINDRDVLAKKSDPRPDGGVKEIMVPDDPDDKPYEVTRNPKNGHFLSVWTEALEDEYMNLVASGFTNKKISKLDHMPSAGTISTKLNKDSDFRQRYMEHKKLAADMLIDQTLDIADDEDGDLTPEGKPNPSKVSRDKLRIYSRQWFASKMNPERYGTARVSHEAGDSLTQLLENVSNSPLGSPQGLVVNGDFKEVDDIEVPKIDHSENHPTHPGYVEGSISADPANRLGK